MERFERIILDDVGCVGKNSYICKPENHVFSQNNPKMSKLAQLKSNLELIKKGLNNPAIKDNPVLLKSLQTKKEAAEAAIKAEESAGPLAAKKSTTTQIGKKVPAKKGGPKKKKIAVKASSKVSKPTPAPAKTSSKPSYDCDDLIAKEKEKAKKRKLAKKKHAKEPVHTPATKTRNIIVKAAEKVETDIHKRLEKGQVKKSEIQKLIKDTKKLLEALNKALKSPKAKKMYGGGDIDKEAERKKLREAFFKSKAGKKMVKGGITGSRVDDMANGYMSAILFAESDSEGESLDYNHSISDFDAKTISDIKAMLQKYLNKNKATIEKSGLDDNQIGMDVWYTQKGHGAGFFDRGLEKSVEDKLTNSAKELVRHPDAEVGDNGKIYINGLKSAKGKKMAKGGSMNDFVEYLNELGAPEDDMKENGGRIPESYRNRYGEWLKKNDKIAFNVAHQDWQRENK